MADQAINRRRFLGAVAAFSGAAWGAAVLRFRGVRRLDVARPLAPMGETALFGELRAGSRIDRWTIESVRQTSGAVTVAMRTGDGERFQVDVLRRDDAMPGVARTRSLSLYLVNGGRGRLASIEEHGLGAMALAGWLDAREAAGHASPSLYTLRERAARPSAAAVAIG